MKLLTINVHAWLEENQEEKINILAKVIAEKEYDIIALQEVNQLMDSKVVYDHIRVDNYGWILLNKINEYTKTDYYYHWSNSHIGYGKYEEGVAIISKHKIISEDEFYCTRSQSVRRISARRIVNITIDYKGKEIEFYSCHMNLPNAIDEDMKKSVETILNRSGKNENLKILMGDFNVDKNISREDYDKIVSCGLYDTYEEAEVKDSGITVAGKIHGWDSNSLDKRIDYIFTNQKVNVISSNVIFNGENEAVVSDHYGVEVVLNV